jgi:transcriptional regulator with XRE-family HTH domain
MSDAHKLFGGKVREHRLRQGLTQEALAEKCGLHWTYIGGLERGEKNPTLGTISRLADGLGVGARDFFDRRGIRIYAELTRLLGKEDPQTKAMAIDVLRDVISWKQRYGIKK